VTPDVPSSPSAVEQHAHHADPKGFWAKYVFSTDHKVIGIQFIFSSMIWGIVGGGLAMLVRYKIAWPGAALPVFGGAFPDGVMDNQFYNMAFTMHASIMIFLVVIPVLVGGFGNFLIPLLIGARDMAFPKLNMTIWALFITSILQLLATPVLGAAMIMLILERTAGTAIFVPETTVIGTEAFRAPGSEGQPLLFQHLFWFYSHPAVYIMILPAMGFVSDIISTFARKPLFGYRPMVYSISAIAGLGFVVWGHHMFVSGMNPYLGSAFMVSTMMIALPSAVKVFNWIGTLWGGQIRFTASMCFAVAFVSMFIIGGLSGIFMAATPVDIQIHDTYFIVGHIHYVLFTGSLFGVFAGIYYWYPKMFGRLMNERLGRWHFWLTFIFGNGTFFLMHIVGLGGMQRRIADPLQYEHLHGWIAVSNQVMTASAFVLFLAQILFFFNFFRSLTGGEKAGRNPWRANSLEWAADSPPPHGNFGETVPTVFRGPYEYASPDVDEDYLPQSRDIERDKKTS